MELTSLKYLLNKSIFIIIIGHIGVYIEHYLGGQAEFQTNINCIMVDIALIPPPPPSFSTPPFPPNLTYPTGSEPLPLVEGCGLLQHHLSSLRSEDAAVPAPPLSKGMWVAWSHSTEEPGREKDEGGPMKWEAH